MINIVIHIYFYANAILTGMYIADNHYTKEDNRFTLIILILLMLAFGSLIYSFDIIKESFIWLANNSQIGFLITFYFTKEYSNLTYWQIERINSFKKNERSFMAFCSNFCIDLINKRFPITIFKPNDGFELDKDINEYLKKGQKGIIISITQENVFSDSKSFEVRFPSEFKGNLEAQANEIFNIDIDFIKYKLN